MKSRRGYILQNDITIEKIITFYYRELPRNFYTSGEKHYFWEFVYIDKGELEVFTDQEVYHLSQGDIIFYKPNLFHGGKAHNGTAPNLIIISFECCSPAMAYFEDKIIRLQQQERQLLSTIVQEGNQVFDPPVHSPYVRGTPFRSTDATFGGEQLIRNYLEIFLIQLIRRINSQTHLQRPTSLPIVKQEDELVASVIHFLQSHTSENFTFSQLCEKFAVSHTRMKALFRGKMNMGVMEYFNHLKIEQAKLLIREQCWTITEIAGKLGYSSPHYFSKQFKRMTDMAPSEYARSIRAFLINKT